MTRNHLQEQLVSLALQPRNLARALSVRMAGAVPRVTTVIALDGQWLKLLQADGPPKARRITKLLAVGIEQAGTEQIQRAFREACTVEGLSAGEVLIANPTHLCTVRLFSLPSTDPKEIRDIVELQAEKHTPYAKEEIITDFTIIERDRSGYSRVLLIIAHQDVIHRLVQFTDGAALLLDRVGCELEGLIHWFKAAKPEAAGQEAGTLIVDVDGGTTTVLVMQRGMPRFHRSLATGAAQLLEDAARSGEHLVGELQRSLEAVEAEGAGLKVQSVVLTGRLQQLGDLKAQIERGLNLPVTAVEPWAACQMTPGAKTASERLPDVSFAGLVGLALAPTAIDLTPTATKLRQAFEERARALVVLGCQVVGIMILASLLMIGQGYKSQRYYQTLRAMHRSAAAPALEVEEALQQIEVVRERLRHQGLLLEGVDALAAASPPEIRWKSLTFIQGQGFTLKGSSAELPKIYDFVAALNGSPLFERVEATRVATKKGEAEGSATDFEISCTLRQAGG